MNKEDKNKVLGCKRFYPWAKKEQSRPKRSQQRYLSGGMRTEVKREKTTATYSGRGNKDIHVNQRKIEGKAVDIYMTYCIYILWKNPVNKSVPVTGQRDFGH